MKTAAPRKNTQFFASMPRPCPYLDGQIERQIFVELRQKENLLIQNSAFAQIGFRRSHKTVYIPDCPACHACTSVRLPVRDFVLSNNQRRILKRNTDLSLTIGRAIATTEQYNLFIAYQQHRHPDGDMRTMMWDEYHAMIEDGGDLSRIMEWRDSENRLQAAMLVDRLTDGASAVYSFYNPRDNRRSLGKFMIFSLVERVKEAAGAYVYLGYYVKNSPTMDYKGHFQPLEAWLGGKWQPFSLQPAL